jgi:hypothetical protein
VSRVDDDDDDDDDALAVVTSRREVSRMFVPVHQTTRCHDADDPLPVLQVTQLRGDFTVCAASNCRGDWCGCGRNR